MNISLAITTSLLILGVFTFNISSTFGQFIPSQQQSLSQPCENNGHAVLGTGKQILKQSNHCIIIENNNAPTGTCPIGTVLQNGVCVPISSTCPIGSVLQNGVCVPFTNPTQSAPVAVAIASPSSTVSGDTVTLVGSGSYATTSGATIVSYSWVQTSEPFVTLNGATTANPTFTAPTVSTSTPLTFSLTVTDSQGLTSNPDSVTITVNP